MSETIAGDGAAPDAVAGPRFLSKEDILWADDREYKDVPVPEWGGTVRVRSLSGTERDAYEAETIQIQSDGSTKPDLTNVRAKLVARSMIDPESGERVFTDREVAALGDKSAAALDRLFDECRRLSRLRGAEEVEEAAGNSNGALSAVTGSD